MSISSIEETLENDEVETFFLNAIRVGMVFGPSIGYFAQMREIRVTHNCDGFAPLLSLILLGSNTLRIYYWIGAQFDIALLFQAIVMILVQLGLVHVVLRAQVSHAAAASANPNTNTVVGGGTNTPNGVGSTNASTPHAGHEASGLSSNSANAQSPMSASLHPDYATLVRTPKQFVRLASSNPAGCADAFLFSPFPSAFRTLTPILFAAKFITMAFLMGAASFLIYFVGGWDAAEYIGYTALCLEGCLYLPQIHLNYTRRSTEGLTWVLLCTWVGGDVAKLLYFIFDGQPFPFIVCSCFQLTCDVIMITQVILYRKNRKGASIYGGSDIHTIVGGGGGGGSTIINMGGAATGIKEGSPTTTTAGNGVEMHPFRSISGQPNTAAAADNGGEKIVTRGQYGR